MKQKLLLISFFTCFLLTAEDSSSLVIDSDKMEYREQNLILYDNVSIQSDLGHFQADLAEWEEKGDELSLEGNVTGLLKDGTAIECGFAECQLESRHLKLKEGVERILLKDSIHERYSLESKKMDLEISSKRQIQHLLVEGSVTFECPNEISVKADKAVYARSLEGPETEPLFGIMSLSGQENLCEFSNLVGDQLTAKEVVLNFVKKHVTIESPKGVLSLENPEEKLEVSAERLFWDQGGRKVVLHENIKASLPGMGQFSVSDEMFLSYQTKEGKKELKKLECLGETHLVVEDLKKNYAYTFACYGQVSVDRDEQIILMSSPVNAAGFTDKGTQVFFQDGLAKMSADRVHLYFLEGDEKPILEKVILEGQVQLMNRLTQLLDGETPIQYALADTIEYIPKSKELNLTSSSQQRVLFQDSVNRIQMSAPALKIKRSSAAQRGYIQGLGDVRFSFAKNEKDLIQNTFFWEGGASNG